MAFSADGILAKELSRSDAAPAYAAGGAALVIVEATPVNCFGDGLDAENLAALVEAIHEGGALAAPARAEGVAGADEDEIAHFPAPAQETKVPPA